MTHTMKVFSGMSVDSLGYERSYQRGSLRGLRRSNRMHWISKDGLGTAIWLFWVMVIGLALSFGILWGFNTLAVEAERGAPHRESAFLKKAGIEHEIPLVKSQESAALVALKRSCQMAGLPALAGLLLVSLNLWWHKRPYRITEDPGFIDPIAKGRTVK